MIILWFILTFIIGGWVGLIIAAVFGLCRDAKELGYLKQQVADMQDWLDGYCRAQEDYIEKLEHELRDYRAKDTGAE